MSTSPHQLAFELVRDANQRNHTYDGTPKVPVPYQLYNDEYARNDMAHVAGEVIAGNINLQNTVLFERRAAVEATFAEAIMSDMAATAEQAVS